VWSVPGRGFPHGHILPQSVWRSRGYERLVVSLSKNGDHQRPAVHKLVARAFLGPLPKGLQVRHLDGDSLNNHLSNLRYGTPLENQHDRFRHGTWTNANQERCKRRHLLKDPNLASWARAGSRVCLACCRGRDAVKAGARRGVELDWQAEADRCYALIIGESTPERAA
jgi:hypothetical protein